MYSKIELQKIGEAYVKDLLVAKNFIVTAQNARHSPFEFDLVCSKNRQFYVVEVRTTANGRDSPLHYFPAKKLSTLFKGVSLYYPSAVLLCVLVQITAHSKNAEFFRGTELL